MVVVRDGLPSDRFFLRGLLEAEGMPAVVDPAEFLVAECDGRVVGAARGEEIEGEVWVRPIAVVSSARGRGVGTLLLLRLSRRHGTLRLVARGAVSGFYHRLGFDDVPWSRVPEALRAECAACSDRVECDPRPMRGPDPDFRAARP